MMQSMMIQAAAAMLLLSLSTSAQTVQDNAHAQATITVHHNHNDVPVRVFVLAGDDAAEGYASVAHLRELLNQTFSVRRNFQHLLDDNGQDFMIRDDVFVMMDPFGSDVSWKSGPLGLSDSNFTFGATPQTFGPELEMGHVLGNVFDEPVVIVKATYSGKSLANQFLSPTSAGSQVDAGFQYKHMMRSVQRTMENMDNILQGAALQHYQRGNKHAVIAGLVWFHGYADFFDDASRDAYEQNLENFLLDVRDDLVVLNNGENGQYTKVFKVNADDLPIVVAQLGGRGPAAPPNEQAFRSMQHEVTRKQHEELGLPTAFCPTARFYRPLDINATSILNAGDAANADFEHYFQRADTMIDIGGAFAAALLRVGNYPLSDTNDSDDMHGGVVGDGSAPAEDNANPIAKTTAFVNSGGFKLAIVVICLSLVFGLIGMAIFKKDPYLRRRRAANGGNGGQQSEQTFADGRTTCIAIEDDAELCDVDLDEGPLPALRRQQPAAAAAAAPPLPDIASGNSTSATDVSSDSGSNPFGVVADNNSDGYAAPAVVMDPPVDTKIADMELI